MSEFEDRENEELGDLPEPIGIERGEYEQTTGNTAPPPGRTITKGRLDAGTPTDIAREQRALDLHGEIGQRGIAANVTSVWNGRPINARDFMHIGVDTAIAVVDNPGAEDVTARLFYTVPQGYTGILRKIAFDPNFTLSFGGNAIGFSDLCDGTWHTAVLTTLLLNGVAVPDYANLSLGDTVELDLPTWVIGRENDVFQLNITYDRDVLLELATCESPGFSGSVTQRMSMYGQNLLTRGLPKEFEIASQYFSGSVKQ